MASLRRFTTAQAPPGLLQEIREFLDRAFDGSFSDDDWEHALGGWHVVAEDGGAVVSHAAVVPRVLDVGGRPLRAGYVEAVATVQARRRQGLGSLVMAEISRLVRREFEMGALSTGAHGFYAAHGWEPWQGPTFVRHGSQRVRTEEEDDGVMVLRFGPSRGVDLRAPISCPARAGDDW